MAPAGMGWDGMGVGLDGGRIGSDRIGWGGTVLGEIQALGDLFTGWDQMGSDWTGGTAMRWSNVPLMRWGWCL